MNPSHENSDPIMSSFLIFTTSDTLPDCDGLAGLQDEADCPLSSIKLRKGGPGDANGGKLWYFDDPENPTTKPHLVYKPAKQEWKKAPDGDWWIGWPKDSPPTASDLLRGESNRYGGYSIELNDKQRWTVPNAFMLPQELGFDEHGSLTLVRKHEFQSVYEKTLWAFDFASDRYMLDDRIDSESILPVTKYCSQMLSLNYRITWQIAVLLRLFDLQTLWSCLLMTTDVEKIHQLIDELEKKGSAETGDTPDTGSGEND